MPERFFGTTLDSSPDLWLPLSAQPLLSQKPLNDPEPDRRDGCRQVEEDRWRLCGSLGLRRSILAVIASLLLPASLRGTLVSEAGRGTPFWIRLRSLHSPAHRKGFQDRAARSNPLLLEAMEFYW
jgi:hypothetical protein